MGLRPELVHVGMGKPPRLSKCQSRAIGGYYVLYGHVSEQARLNLRRRGLQARVEAVEYRTCYGTTQVVCGLGGEALRIAEPRGKGPIRCRFRTAQALVTVRAQLRHDGVYASLHIWQLVQGENGPMLEARELARGPLNDLFGQSDLQRFRPAIARAHHLLETEQAPHFAVQHARQARPGRSPYRHSA